MFECYTFIRYLPAHKLHQRTHVVPIVNEPLRICECRYIGCSIGCNGPPYAHTFGAEQTALASPSSLLCIE